MKTPRSRLVQYVTALTGFVLLGVVVLSASASAGTSSPTGDSAQSLSAARAGSSAALSNLARTKSGKLSPRLLRLSQSSVSTASLKAQAASVGLPFSGPGSLLRAAGGKQLVVYVRVSGSAANAGTAIEKAGASIVNVSKRYGVVTAAISPRGLQALGKLPVVAAAWEALAPMLSATCPSGAVVSEGDSQLGAASARSTYSVDGSGVTVGILSDSFDALGSASTGASAGELPGTGNTCLGQTTPVSVLEDDTSGIDEGRAMLEVVHDLAPGAALDFATAYGGLYGMADNIRALRDAGAKVIADDVTYFAEPMFQKGPIDAAIDDVTTSGVSYFSSAGNSNQVVGGHNVGSYEAPAYRPTSCPAELDALTGPYPYPDCHDFDPGAGVDGGANYTLADGGYLAIDLQWAEPWAGVGTDLDMILIDADTGDLLDYSLYSNSGASGTQVPFEYMGYYENATGASENVEVVIARYSGTAQPRLKYVIVQSDGVTSVEHNSSSGGDVVGPTIFGHNGGENTISIAAVPYNDSTTSESYTSHGPVTYYYGPADGITPAAALSSPLVLSKPDIAATDCAQTSFFYPPAVGGIFRFCGTSEAASHAAPVAALMLQRDPALAPSQVMARLKTTADAVTNGGTSDVVGSGLIDALGAVGVSTPTFSLSQSSYSISEAGPSTTITIKRTGDTSSAVSVHVATANGTATAGSDYTAVDETVSFAVGETSKTVSVPITDDVSTEGNETVSLSLSSPTGGELGWPSTATLTIVDNERSFALSAASYSVNEGGGSAPITITRSGSVAVPDSVHFATANGTAIAGSDYTTVSQDVSFAAGETSKIVSVPIADDVLTEGSETVSLSLSSPSAGAELGSPSTATLTIVDNERAFALSAASYSVSEGGGSVPITITRSGSTAVPDSVHFATANGTAIAGSDYTTVSQDVSFAAGETSKIVSVPITDDSLVEGSETVSLALSSPSAGTTLGSPSTATLTIQDNDAALAFSAATYSVKESGGLATITVTRTGLTSSAVSVHFATANGTATAGSDYTAVSQTVSFAAGESSKTVAVPITNDKLLEGNETVRLTLSSPSAGAALVSPSTATLTIINSPGKIASAKLTKTSFKSSQARKVKLVVSFSPASRKFNYLLSFKKGVKWVTVRSVKKNGNFAGTRRMTVKSLFGKKAVKRGRYRLKLTADANSRTLSFKVT
jgi:hypothetical protein